MPNVARGMPHRGSMFTQTCGSLVRALQALHCTCAAECAAVASCMHSQMQPQMFRTSRFMFGQQCGHAMINSTRRARSCLPMGVIRSMRRLVLPNRMPIRPHRICVRHAPRPCRRKHGKHLAPPLRHRLCSLQCHVQWHTRGCRFCQKQVRTNAHVHRPHAVGADSLRACMVCKIAVHIYSDLDHCTGVQALNSNRRTCQERRPFLVHVRAVGRRRGKLLSAAFQLPNRPSHPRQFFHPIGQSGMCGWACPKQAR